MKLSELKTMLEQENQGDDPVVAVDVYGENHHITMVDFYDGAEGGPPQLSIYYGDVVMDDDT